MHIAYRFPKDLSGEIDATNVTLQQDLSMLEDCETSWQMEFHTGQFITISRQRKPYTRFSIQL